MPRKIYSEETKQAILNTALAARAEGKNWSETYEYAKQAGYTGSPQGITQMLRAAKEKSGGPAEEVMTGATSSEAPAAAETTAPAKAKKVKKTSKKAPKAPKAAKKSAPKAKKAAVGGPRYDDATKDTIVNAVNDARKGGAKWSEAHAVAKSAGYQGGVQALMLLCRKQTKIAEKAAKAAKLGKPKGKPGRKPGFKVAAKPAATGGDSIEQLINREIQTRVNAAMEAAIAALKSLIS